MHVKIRTKVTKCIREKMTLYVRVGEPLNHIQQETKSARLIALCKRSFFVTILFSKNVNFHARLFAGNVWREISVFGYSDPNTGIDQSEHVL